MLLLAINAWLIYQTRRTELAQISRANSNLAQAVTAQVEGSIAEVEHVLDNIVFALERSDLTTDSLQRMQPMLVSQVAAIKQLKGLFVYDAAGRWIVNSEASWDPSRNNADRSYFVHHRNNPSVRPLISAPIVSRSSGEWIIPVSRRVNDPDGNFQGVVLGTLSVRNLGEFLNKFAIGQQGAIAVILAGRILVRRPFSEQDLGKRLPASPLQTLFATQPSGTADARSTVDGVQRIISFEHMQNYPVLVTVAVGKDEALADWESTSIMQTAWVIVLCMMVAGAGTFVIRAIRLRVQAEAGLRDARDALTEANQRLAHLAQYDELTGLPNRRYFDSRLHRAFREAQRDKHSLAIVMIDVDQFKQYNDRYGHVEGDHCLQLVADAVQSVARRPYDFVARYGGEEMVMLLPKTDSAGAERVAEAGRVAVLNLRIRHEASSLGMASISLGVACLTPQAHDMPEDLIRVADAALYKAKREGRNRVCIDPQPGFAAG
ncbi:sensor domain-containing diguanylate cyclase [Variovorax sp. PAMC 28711]|uniref:sensor domain-containing diguanylate cyclase n=1 Tax=Variovorax sp. PAMC 28711 TaxID=1795631 RepID=UPI000A49DAB6|nr:diguanylate cyclase [Variovorax sp. PAMC 28711]